MIMAAPVAWDDSGRKGVSVGMSLSSFPSASGAPAGQRGKELLVWAVATRHNVNRSRIFFIGKRCRNPKSETRNPKEGRRPKFERSRRVCDRCSEVFRNWSFGFLSAFELRISDFPSYSNIFIPQFRIFGNEFAHHLDARGILQHLDL